MAREFDDARRVRSRYEAVLGDHNSAADAHILSKYKAASKAVAEIEEAYNALDSEINASRTGANIIAQTNGIEIIRTEGD